MASLLRNLVPFGLLAPNKPRHFREMLKVAWENKDHPLYAWRILRHGVCDGCSLGPRGLRDDVMEGVHLCLTRLKLLRLNTMEGFREDDVKDIAHLRRMTNEQLQSLGRVPFPMIYRPGMRGFQRIGWEEAVRITSEKMRATPPDRMAFFATSRGLSNEAYYIFQKLARLVGTNNVDLAARLCHAPTVDGLGATLGITAPTCSLSDFIGTDLLILFGTDLANNQPVSVKYMHYAKKAGTKILVINPYREPALERYWVPSVAESALFGTQLMDDFFQVRVGGDSAFINGVVKRLVEIGGIDENFVRDHTNGFEELKSALASQNWEDIEEASGVLRADIFRFADLYAKARTAVLCYSMGITQHASGVENVYSIVNLALSRGMIGREKTGIMPIRGHSGVQGGGECGVAPNRFPGGLPVNAETAAMLAEAWGGPIPATPGMMITEALEAAHEGGLDILYSVGGNMLATMPDPDFIREAYGRTGLRIHQDIVLNTSTVLEPGEAVLVLPAQTRYEHKGGITSTSTERRIRFSPEIAGPRVAEARAEWEIMALVGRAVVPNGAKLFNYSSTRQIREEMDRTMPVYKGIAELRSEGDSLQWGGRHLLDGGVCAKMPGGRGRFSVVRPRPRRPPAGMLALATRRGRQFNSMTYGSRDPITDSTCRDTIILSRADAFALGVNDGDGILLKNETGSMRGVAMISDVREGTVQAFWPEANVLIPREYDPISGVPDYNAFVRIDRI